MTDGNDMAYPAGYDVPENDRSGNPIPPHYPGLTKREAFAMAAMHGIRSYQALEPQRVADMAVEQADALIAALNKPQETKA